VDRAHSLRRPLRLLAAPAVVLLAAAAMAMPAGAQTTGAPGDFRGSADASALDIQVLGNGLTLGKSHADIASGPKANASGIALLLPGAGNQGETDATAANEGETNGNLPPGTCQALVPPSVPVVSLDTGCSSASASVHGGDPAALSSASVASLDVNAADVLAQLPLSQITDQVDQLLAQLKDVFTNLDTSGIKADSLISKLIDALNQSGDLVRVTLGPTTASTQASTGNPNVVNATASAQGAVIEVLPRDLLQLKPVIKIEIGASSNSVTVDRTTGEATVAFEPSLVKVTLADDIAAVLPPGVPNPLTVTPGQTVCLPLPDPLQSCITVGNGSQSKLADGTTHAEAAAVSLQLLTGLPGGGVQASLARTVVEGLVVAQEGTRAETATPDKVAANTGGTTNAALLGGLLAAAVVGYCLVRPARRRDELADPPTS